MKKFEQELGALRERMAEMGDLAESMVARAIQALWAPGNAAHREKVDADELRMDQMQLAIDAEAIRLLTVYGPVAANLRFILSASRVDSELERIGDQTVSMCHHVQLMVSHGDVAPLPQFERMTKLVRNILHDAVKAFRLEDSARAKSTMAEDEMVDALNDQIIRELLQSDDEQAPPRRGPEDIAAALAQILIAQSLERIADQACNVCEQIVYMVEGADIRHRHPPP